jgi:Fe(3+) dicitrate transport protein
VRLGLDMYYVDSMPTAGSDAGIQNTDAHVVFDLEIAYKLKEDSARIFVLVQNLFDEEYIVAARPAGARPGMPQTVLAGVKFSL